MLQSSRRGEHRARVECGSGGSTQRAVISNIGLVEVLECNGSHEPDIRSKASCRLSASTSPPSLGKLEPIFSDLIAFLMGSAYVQTLRVGYHYDVVGRDIIYLTALAPRGDPRIAAVNSWCCPDLPCRLGAHFSASAVLLLLSLMNFFAGWLRLVLRDIMPAVQGCPLNRKSRGVGRI